MLTGAPDTPRAGSSGLRPRAPAARRTSVRVSGRAVQGARRPPIGGCNGSRRRRLGQDKAPGVGGFAHEAPRRHGRARQCARGRGSNPDAACRRHTPRLRRPQGGSHAGAPVHRGPSWPAGHAAAQDPRNGDGLARRVAGRRAHGRAGVPSKPSPGGQCHSGTRRARHAADGAPGGADLANPAAPEC